MAFWNLFTRQRRTSSVRRNHELSSADFQSDRGYGDADLRVEAREVDVMTLHSVGRDQKNCKELN